MEFQVKEEVKDFLAGLYLDDPAFLRAMFPDVFDVPFSPLHNQIFDVFESSKRKKLILAPRGIGKTSLARGRACKSILYGDKHFIVYVDRSLELAELQTENMKRELLTNTNVLKFFGDIRNNISGDPTIEGIDEAFSKKAWVAFGNTLVLPRGCGQAIRGVSWNNYRPDLIILDDPEDRKELRNENNRKENRRWLFGDVIWAGSLVRKDLEIIYIDTLKHQDALPIHIIEAGGWESVRLAICDENYKSLAPEFMSDDYIAEVVKEYREDGQLDIFHQEFMNQPISPESAGFRRDFFHHYQESNLTKDEQLEMENIVLIDPAKTATPKSDDTAIIVVGLSRTGNKIRVRDAFSGKVYPDELYRIAFEMARNFRATAMAYEVTGLNEWISFPIKNEAHMRGMTDLELIELKSGNKSKDERIASLIPLYRRGLIWHNEACCGKLEEQLLGFPYSRLRDLMDVLAYVVKLSGIGERYMFGGTELGMNAEYRGDFEKAWPSEKEYAGLVNEPPIEAEWQFV